jgi:glycosyltransferase involved in cell wall biosynthesis
VAERLSPPPSICLNMIVRNEAHIVHELLDSVVPHIDAWVVVDTGSDDGTQEAIRNYMADHGIPARTGPRRFPSRRDTVITSG